MDIGTTPPDLAWQMLRMLRSDPPGWARKGDRKAVFCASLEQAEQLFRSARRVTTAASPLLLFYGLSQAGRAVAAAAVGVKNGWRLSGHGITSGGMGTIGPKSLFSLPMHDQGTGSFTQLADILRCGSLPTPVQLGDLWCILPEAERFPLPGMGTVRPLYVAAIPGIPGSRDVRAHVYPVPTRLPHGHMPQDEPSSIESGFWPSERIAISSFLSNYPSLASFDFITPEGQPFGLQLLSEGLGQVPLMWRRSSEAAKDVQELETRTVGYRSEQYAFPSVGTSDKPTHPFMLWWAVLFALSKIARYEPDGWAKLIAVNDSPAATAIEHMLAQAILVLPELIHRTVLEAAGVPLTQAP